jgi:translation elongation factor EF-G
VLAEALRRAGTQAYEPVHRFRVEAPADTLGALLPVPAALWAVPENTGIRGETCSVEGTVPAARLHEPAQRLPGLTRGRGRDGERLRTLRGGHPRHGPVSDDPYPKKLKLTHQS